MSVTPRRVVVAGHDLKFFRTLQRALEGTGLFEFRVDLWAGHRQHDARQSRELLDWAETIICEWCLGNAVWYANHKRRHQHMLIRFHLQERQTPFPHMLKLDAVSKIIFVGPHIEKEAHQRLGIPPEKTCVIPNLIDVDRFNLPKYSGAFFNLGIIGIAPRRKRMDLAVDLLETLKESDERYTLHIKGAHPASYDWLWARTLERRYYLEQFERINSSPHRNSIVFDPPADDVPEWLRCIGFILSPSDFESFHVAVGEGMASGSLPVIWDWEGAREIWDPKYLVQSVSEAAERIEELRQSPELERLREDVRKYVSERFDTEVIRDRWLELLNPAKPARPARKPVRKDKVLVVVLAIDNWPTFHRREMLEALARQMESDAEFLIVEPGNHYQTLVDKQWATPEELQYYTRLEPIQVGPNIWKFRSLVSGFPDELARPPDLAWGLSTKNLLGKRIRRMFPGLKVIFWLYKPDQWNRWLGPDDQYVYECYDDYTRSFGSGAPLLKMALLERAILPHARASFFTSSKLMELKGPLSPRPVLAENGVAYHVFAQHRRDVKPRSNPVRVGYLGNLSDFFDWEAMIHAADNLPQVSFHFHGPIDPQAEKEKGELIEQLRCRPNCHFTGRITREEGARLLPGYNTLLIPFVQNPAMDAVNPLKLWEYFATGRPVVSSPMAAIESLNHIIYFAKTQDDWVRQIQAATGEDSRELRSQRIRLAKEHDWSEITKIHARVLREIFPSL